MEYIQSEKQKGECIFCQVLNMPDGPENLVVHRGSRAFVILNRYPYTSGHVMIAPMAHLASLEDLDVATRSELMELTTAAMVVLRREYRPHGFNIGLNIGEAAGAGILDHVHMHVVPRWAGDTNFMASLAGTRVLPESLEDTFNRLKKAWEER